MKWENIFRNAAFLGKSEIDWTGRAECFLKAAFLEEKFSPSWLLKRTALLQFFYSAWMAGPSPSSVLKLLRTCTGLKPDSAKRILEACRVRNSWLRWYGSCFSMMNRLLKICCAVLWPGLIPACSSTSSSSTLALSWLRITWSLILPGWLIRLIVR